MLNRIHVSSIFFILAFSASAFCTDRYTIKSPDTRISVAVWLTPHGEPSYSIVHSGSTVLRQSKLGIIRSDGDFSSNLLLDSVSDVQSVTDKYSVLHGKRLVCSYFIDGYPGKYVVLARRTGGVWCIAGIDGEHSPHTITFDLPSISTATEGVLIGDSDTGKDFIERKVDISKPIQLKLQPYGGFVMKTVSP